MKQQKYFLSDLHDLCTGYIEKCYNINNLKMYDLCVEYHINGCKMKDETKQYILNYFNSL